ncbi:hypothetical protein EDB19DRAFT_1636766, partial [Suillus lakei]
LSNAGDAILSWQCGFFRKGDLSRSEPGWLVRQINLRKMKGRSLVLFRTYRLLTRTGLIPRDHHNTPCRAQAVQVRRTHTSPTLASRSLFPRLSTYLLDNFTSRNRTSPYFLLKTSSSHCFTQDVSFTLAEIWNAFQNVHTPSLVPQLDLSSPPRFDNPFLVSIAYQHYRSHSWVVKSVIKFCVDYLLYKRGPVFQRGLSGIV